MESYGYVEAAKQFIEQHRSTEAMCTLTDKHYTHLLNCVNWFEEKNTDIVDNDNEKDINIRGFAFNNLKFCNRIKSSFDMKIEYFQNDSKFYLVKIIECDYEVLLNIVLQYTTDDFYVI